MKFKFTKLKIVSSTVLTLTAGLLTLAGSPTAAQDSTPWIKTDQTSVRLISALPNLGNRKEVKLGLQFKLKKGWKIYWRTPGDAGFPPNLNWQKSENLVKTDFG